MNAGIVLRAVMIIAGLVLLLVTLISLAKRNLTESISLVWGVLSVLLILAGVLLRPVLWGKYVSMKGNFILMAVAVCILWFLYFLSTQIALLNRKNQELAMQVSLLNHENEMMMQRIDKLQEQLSTAKVERNEN